MSVQATVVFADLMGSTGVFETIGNARASKVVVRLTQWIGEVCAQHHGRVIKSLGDGVLVTFGEERDAVAAVVELQRVHQRRMATDAQSANLPIRIGVARGEVEIVDNDCYGDAVNVASRLSDLSGPQQIWANGLSADDSHLRPEGVRFRPLGLISIRGRNEPCEVMQIEWHENLRSDFLTMQAEPSLQELREVGLLVGEIALTWQQTSRQYPSTELPIRIGRVAQADFVVNDPRVSRAHARVEWRNGSFLLVDVSTYGSWVRFSGGGSDLLLRREECVLHGEGEIALGASFSDTSVPTIGFWVA